MKAVVCYIGLGSNVGNRRKKIQFAVNQLKNLPRTRLLKMSDIYETDPIGPVRQADYHNAVAKIKTRLSPIGLLVELKRIEALCGRKPNTVRWGPRELDLDILTYGKLRFSSTFLQIPHKQMPYRDFVLRPGKDVGLPA